MPTVMRRRDILAAGIGGAALSRLGRACKTESGSRPFLMPFISERLRLPMFPSMGFGRDVERAGKAEYFA
jgi:hypothetical protein